MKKIEIKDLEFDTIYDVASCFKKARNITKLMYKIIEEIPKQNTPVVVYSAKYKFYNFDYAFVLYCIKLWLIDEDISELELAKFLAFFIKESDDEFLSL